MYPDPIKNPNLKLEIEKENNGSFLCEKIVKTPELLRYVSEDYIHQNWSKILNKNINAIKYMPQFVKDNYKASSSASS